MVGQPLFVTFRLHSSLPAGRAFPPVQLTDGKSFVTMDRILDRAETGPKYLSVPEIAGYMISNLLDGDRRFNRYRLHHYVVMPNHVHLLVTPSVISAKWLGPLKGFTAYQANAFLGLKGKPFWQQESYDHRVRSSDEFDRIKRYIENNPVKAGLVAQPSDFEWSSARACSKQAAG